MFLGKSSPVPPPYQEAFLLYAGRDIGTRFCLSMWRRCQFSYQMGNIWMKRLFQGEYIELVCSNLEFQ
jgi:hypothetical protein